MTPPRPKGLPGALLAAILLGILASSMLLVDYLRPAPAFCGYDGGCAALKSTPVAWAFGVPLPAVGLGGFLLLLALAMTPGALARRLLAGTAVLAGLGGLGLLAFQVHLGVFCKFCVMVDGATMVIAALSIHRLKGEWDGWHTSTPLSRASMGVVALVLAAGPFVAGRFVPTGVPAPVAQEMAATPRGMVTLVDFIDFECPHCRMTHEALQPVLAGRESRVRVVRKHVPLAAIHHGAMEAARAACCGEAQGKSDAMANALVHCPAERLTREGCEDLARTIGLDVDRFRACVTDPATDARIKSDIQTFRECGGHGLPTLFVDAQKLEGSQSTRELEEVFTQVAPRT